MDPRRKSGGRSSRLEGRRSSRGNSPRRDRRGRGPRDASLRVGSDAPETELDCGDPPRSPTEVAAMSYEEVQKVWMNGQLVDFADAKIHAFSHVFHYGSAMFEGTRVYNTRNGPAAFRLDEHIKRLLRLLQGLPDGDPLHAGGVPGRDLRDDPRQRLRRLLHPARRLPGTRCSRRQPVQEPGRRHHRGLALGPVPRRGRRSRRAWTSAYRRGTGWRRTRSRRWRRPPATT